METPEIEVKAPLISLAWNDISVSLIHLDSNNDSPAIAVYPEADAVKLPHAKKMVRQQQQQVSQKPLKTCHICGRGFHKATYLKRHIQSHGSVKPYKCKICGWGFFQYCNLKRHMISHSHNGEGFACRHCPAAFTTKSVLSVHLRDAHGDNLKNPAHVQI